MFWALWAPSLVSRPCYRSDPVLLRDEEDDLAVVADMVAADKTAKVVAVDSIEDTSSGSIADSVIFSNKEEAAATAVIIIIT